MEPMSVPLSPVPGLNLPDSTELLQFSELPSVVSSSLVVPAWPVNGPPGATVHVVVAAGPAPRATVRMAVVALNAIRPDRTAVTSRIRPWLRPDAAGCQCRSTVMRPRAAGSGYRLRARVRWPAAGPLRPGRSGP